MADPSPDERPEVLQAQLQPEQVEALFLDLQQTAKIRRVTVRRASESARPTDVEMTLQEAHRLLNDPRTQAVQIQYEYEASVWCDTLMLGPAGMRLVRATLPQDRD